MKKITFIGSGNVATHLAIGLKRAGNEIVQVYSRKLANAQHLARSVEAEGIDRLDRLSENVDIILVAVKDDSIEKLAEKFQMSHVIVAHTSGTISMDVLASCCPNFGVFYPLQTFSKTKSLHLNIIPFCIEGSNKKTADSLRELAGQLSTDVRLVNSAARKAIHLSAVFACNFTNHLYAIADQLLNEQGQDISIIRPLIQETTKKAMAFPPHSVQTGPAKRNDNEVIENHLNLLKEHPEYQKIYQLLSESIKQFPDE